jgi:hypothetical protein
VELRYVSGEAVQTGDRIRYAGGDGVVEFVAVPGAADPETDYYVEEFGGGCMLLTEKFGRVFLSTTEEDGDLALVSRAGG